VCDTVCVLDVTAPDCQLADGAAAGNCITTADGRPILRELRCSSGIGHTATPQLLQLERRCISLFGSVLDEFTFIVIVLAYLTTLLQLYVSKNVKE
jgi:hypothetical protein